MCGRFLLTSSAAAMRQVFRSGDTPTLPPRYNIAPTQPIALIRLEQGQRQFTLARWGLLPAWVKDPAAFSLLINARAESVVEKPAFRAAMKRRRCLVPADGFYEWQRVGTRKQPWLIRLKGEGPFAFAGLWETWTGPNGEEMDTAAIITTAAAPAIAHIHDRMPVILPPDAWDMWLDCARVDATMAQALLAPKPDRLLEAFPVSTAVNRAGQDGPALIEPVAPDAETAAGRRDPPAKTRRKPPAPPEGGQGQLL